jgi:Zn-dependent protease/CBS domain-containing protein
VGIPIARIFGIEIRVQLGWIVVLALIAVIAVGELTQLDPDLPIHVAWALGGVVAFGFFVSSVSHDLAHAVVARRRGVDVRSIAVSFFGGSTPLDPSSPDPRQDVAIAASGPLASLAIGGVLFALTLGAIALGDTFAAASGVLSVLVFLNLLLGFVNLVPAYPLDGGRIVRDIAWRRSGSEQSGWRAASRSGRLTGFVVIGIGVAYLFVEGGATGAMVALTGWFLILSSNSVRDRIKLDDLVGTHTVADVMEPDPVTVTPTLTVDTFAAQLVDRESPLTAVPVIRGDEIVGLLGVAQVRRIRRTEWPNTRVEDVMVTPPKLVLLDPDEPLKGALERLHRLSLDGLPVVEGGRLIGILTRRGVGKFIAERQEQAKAKVTTGPGTGGGAGPTTDSDAGQTP